MSLKLFTSNQPITEQLTEQVYLGLYQNQTAINGMCACDQGQKEVFVADQPYSRAPTLIIHRFLSS